MKTTVGDIEIELWAKGTAKAYRNFIQLCMEGYWDDTIFHRINKGFITQGFDPTELQNKHTNFGEATGESIYSMLKLKEVLVDENDKPLYPPRLIKPIILNNPFFDIIPRIIEFSSNNIVLCNKKFCYRVFSPLLFGEEAEEDEEESVILNKKFTAVEPPRPPNKKRKKDCNSNWESGDEVKTQVELEVMKKEKELIYCLHCNYVIESRIFH
ncbi:Peptidyl-prolyl isomerase cwc27 [Eufriesea mexicana]|uniref:Spliceosome-associated protein CWC27 homolog n=1 Tax=Eufriesea mexicana TaxID=516756 RepID=A0A310SP94_9HYME|nr:Peptidyl-prolyl isomerase cwc27 [Eufriesea mexicana]